MAQARDLAGNLIEIDQAEVSRLPASRRAEAAAALGAGLGGDGLARPAIALTPLGRGRGGPATAPVLIWAAVQRLLEMRIMVLGPECPVVHAHDRDEDDGHEDEVECECG